MRIYIFFFSFLFLSHFSFAQSITATYQAYAMGLNLLEAQMSLDYTNQSYTMKTITQTKGILSLLLDKKQRFITKGNNNTLPPLYSMMTKKGKEKVIDFSKHIDFIDYQTTILSLMKIKKPTSPIIKYQVWDGKRDLLLTFSYLGVEELPLSDTPFQGKADKYTLTVEVLKGKNKGWFFEQMQKKDPPPLRLWFKQVNPILPSFLVRAEFDTSLLGTITILLSDIQSNNKSP